MSKKILIVEDDANIREVLDLALNLEGYEVFKAKNGEDALDLLKSIPLPGLILLDLMMPIMNGWEFMEVIKQNSSWNSIPIVVVSAHLGQENLKNATDFVPKPLELETLLSSIKKHYKESL